MCCNLSHRTDRPSQARMSRAVPLLAASSVCACARQPSLLPRSQTAGAAARRSTPRCPASAAGPCGCTWPSACPACGVPAPPFSPPPGTSPWTGCLALTPWLPRPQERRGNAQFCLPRTGRPTGCVGVAAALLSLEAAVSTCIFRYLVECSYSSSIQRCWLCFSPLSLPLFPELTVLLSTAPPPPPPLATPTSCTIRRTVMRYASAQACVCVQCACMAVSACTCPLKGCVFCFLLCYSSDQTGEQRSITAIKRVETERSHRNHGITCLLMRYKSQW